MECACALGCKIMRVRHVLGKSEIESRRVLVRRCSFSPGSTFQTSCFALSYIAGRQSRLHHGVQHFLLFLTYPFSHNNKKSIPYAAVRRLMRELKELRTSPPEGIRIQLNEESVLDVVGIIEGPGKSCRRGALHPRPVIDASSQRVPHTKGATSA